MRLLIAVALVATCAAHGRHEHGHHDHEHHEHGHDLHGHHDILNLSSADYDKVVDSDAHVWAVKFHSGMCGSCAAFAPAFNDAREQVDGLHWAAVSIDQKENIALAKRLGVLTEGIPNVKLINAADSPLPIVTGDTPSAETLVSKLKETLQSVAATKDDQGYYKAHGRSEL